MTRWEFSIETLKLEAGRPFGLEEKTLNRKGADGWMLSGVFKQEGVADGQHAEYLIFYFQRPLENE